MWQSGDFNLLSLTLLPTAGVCWRERARVGGWGADNFIPAFPLLAATFGKYVNLLSLTVDICNVKIEIDTSQFVESSKYKHACKISDLTEST